MPTSRSAQRQRRQRRVRKKITGTPERPRLSVFRSNRHISAQLIDDEAGRTVAAASTAEVDLRGSTTSNKEAAAKKAELAKQTIDLEVAQAEVKRIQDEIAAANAPPAAAPAEAPAEGGRCRACAASAGVLAHPSSRRSLAVCA